MRVTIIADASFCHETNVAGYGFWVASERGKRGGDGIISSVVENNNSAEMMALMNGLHFGVKHGLIAAGDSVLLQTDCIAAIQAFTNERENLTKQEESVVKWYRHFRNYLALDILFKHVKGHSSRGENRYVTNNICDRKARQNMRKARALYRSQKSLSQLEYGE